MFSIFMSFCITCILAVDHDNNDRSKIDCPEGWLDQSYFGLGIFFSVFWFWFIIHISGCILLNRTVAPEGNHFDDAYQYCYELDSRARLIEIYTEEQMEFLVVALGIFRQFYFNYWINLDHKRGDYWLGAADMAHEGEFRWLFSGEPVGEYVWHEGYRYL